MVWYCRARAFPATSKLCLQEAKGQRLCWGHRSAGDKPSFTVSLSLVMSGQCQLETEWGMDQTWCWHHGDGMLGRCTDSPSAKRARSKCQLWAEIAVPSVGTGRAPVCLCQYRGDPPCARERVRRPCRVLWHETVEAFCPLAINPPSPPQCLPAVPTAPQKVPASGQDRRRCPAPCQAQRCG